MLKENGRCIPDLDQLRQELKRSRDDIQRAKGWWNTFGSSVESYNKSFRPALGCDLVDLFDGKSSAVVVDFMSPPHALQDLSFQLNGRVVIRGISVSLENFPSNKAVGITHITGDLARNRTWSLIRTELGGQGVDLAMERAVAGVDCLPNHSLFQLYTLRRIWRLLKDDGGTFIGQVVDPFKSRWVVDCLQSSK